MRRAPLGAAALAALLTGAALLCAGFIALGVWQVQRLAWKLQLIEQVSRHARAAPVPAPTRRDWLALDPAAQAYRRVQVRGQFLPEPQTRVQALTELGAGHWVMTPLRRPDGSIVYINRGFVPTGLPLPPPPTGTTTVVGLLRLSEPGGAFLRRNDAASGRWTSRDVQALAAAQGLAPALPYFIDAQAPAAAGGAAASAWPRPGMTVVSFRNPHLAYALTWFTLALMPAGAIGLLLRSERRLRLRRSHGAHAGTASAGADKPPGAH